ncbi:hypothetical protein TELCIR_08059 [Teladorsagia circumcincta]|uniref:Uncharacterized protein n=1 Tax=Teladorsagia circumcincta TaxID=45464 RepID=A0A2G9UIL8_TELCI|nr:hypothetical protein TELCIR_08059 [Teladorsagia circumcincta]
MEAVNSPKVRELRCKRDLKALKKQLDEVEDQLMLSESRIASYKSSAEKWEEKEAQLTEKLKARETAVGSLERKLRDIDDELCGTAQTIHALETERDKLAASLEDTKRAAEAEREQYQASVSEWRRRCDCARLQAVIDAKNGEIAEMQMCLQDLKSLSDVHSKVVHELEETRKQLDDERKRNNKQVSSIKTTAEDLMNKLESLTARNCEQAAKISQLEHDMEVELGEACKNEERYRAECEALREKEVLRTEQIQNLCAKFDKLEEDMCLYNRRNSELELQVAQLKEENAQFYKCIELSSIKADKELIKMRFPVSYITVLGTEFSLHLPSMFLLWCLASYPQMPCKSYLSRKFVFNL